jgi:FAD/FMN-containing dehydrogenase
MPNNDYEQKKKKLVQNLLKITKSSDEGSVTLGKTTSNLFRDRSNLKAKRLDVRDFNQPLKIDKKAMTVEAEGMTTFEALVDFTLNQGYIPLVVPELKTITIGGAVSGLAIESSSFKYGLVHESVQEMEVLLADGKTIICNSNNKYSDLFYGLPNSYGTLGYVLKVKAKVRKAPRYIHLIHLRFNNLASYFKQINQIATSMKHEGRSVDYIDGSIFGPDELYITVGFDSNSAPYTSDYTGQRIYYQSIRNRREDYLTIYDYIWRWDTDWFWCSRIIKADKPIVRRFLGKKFLNSRTYGKLMRLENRYGFAKTIGHLQGNKPGESVIQDIEVPVKNAERFYDFFQKEIGISPVWICPTKSTTKNWPYPLYPMDPGALYINFGFWDSVKTTFNPDEGHYNKLIENTVEKLGGMKSLYSTSFYKKSRFEKLYNYAAYKKLKDRYDADRKFKELYEKCVVKR